MTAPESPVDDLEERYSQSGARRVRLNGLRVNNRRYDGALLDPYRRVDGPLSGFWVVRVDPDDITDVRLWDPQVGWLTIPAVR